MGGFNRPDTHSTAISTRLVRCSRRFFVDRKDLLAHKFRDVTTDYSAAEVMSLGEAADLIIRTKDSPTLTVLRMAT